MMNMKSKIIQKFFALGITVILLTQCAMLNSCGKMNARANNATRKLQFSYGFTVKNIPPGASQIDIWAPASQSDDRQTITGLNVKCTFPYSFENEPEYGVRQFHFAHSGQRGAAGEF
jgi:hypothetical protein